MATLVPDVAGAIATHNADVDAHDQSIPAPGLTYPFRGGGSDLNLGIGTTFPDGDASTGGFYSNVAIGGGHTADPQPLNGNLGSVTIGYDNTALGAGVLESLTVGHSNVGIGSDVLGDATTASGCTAVGTQCLQYNLVDSMTAVGNGALQNSTTGTGSVAVGAGALNQQTTGVSNTALGFQALRAVQTSASNTAVGYQALLAATGSNNTAVGSAALDACTSGSSNTAVGGGALGAATTGNNNTAVGLNALAAANGASLVAVGANAGGIAAGNTGATYVGANAGSSSGGSTSGSWMTLIGYGTVGKALGVVALGVDHTGAGAVASVQDEIALGTVNHFVILRTKAAPADASIPTSGFTLWLDDTDGAGKLMVKAKTANGTVATAAVALS